MAGLDKNIDDNPSQIIDHKEIGYELDGSIRHSHRNSEQGEDGGGSRRSTVNHADVDITVNE